MTTHAFVLLAMLLTVHVLAAPAMVDLVPSFVHGRVAEAELSAEVRPDDGRGNTKVNQEEAALSPTMEEFIKYIADVDGSDDMPNGLSFDGAAQDEHRDASLNSERETTTTTTSDGRNVTRTVKSHDEAGIDSAAPVLTDAEISAFMLAAVKDVFATLIERVCCCCCHVGFLRFRRIKKLWFSFLLHFV